VTVTPRRGGGRRGRQGRRVALAAALIGLPVLLGAGVFWWRSLGVEIEIVPDREFWQQGEPITGKIMIHNWTLCKTLINFEDSKFTLRTSGLRRRLRPDPLNRAA
jgi:hypothetical protein